MTTEMTTEESIIAAHLTVLEKSKPGGLKTDGADMDMVEDDQVDSCYASVLEDPSNLFPYLDTALRWLAPLRCGLATRSLP